MAVTAAPVLPAGPRPAPYIAANGGPGRHGQPAPRTLNPYGAVQPIRAPMAVKASVRAR